MPFAQITLIRGRSDDQKAKVIKAVTAAIHESLEAPEENIRVALYEVENTEWGIGGKTAKELGR